MFLPFDALECKARYCDRTSSVRLSVCLSVCNVGGSGPHMLETLETIIARTISPTPSLFVAQRRTSTYSQRNMGGEKVACCSTNAAIILLSLKRVKMVEKLQCRAYRISPTLFRMVPSPTPYGLLFPKIGGSQTHPKLRSLLSHERVKLRTSNLAGIFRGSIRTKAH